MGLGRRASSRTSRADDARRARLILLLAFGDTCATIRSKLDCNDAFIDRWSTRKQGERLAVSHMMVARVLRKHALQPHRLGRYMAPVDPDFETKAADIIGLYLNPRQHAAVFCVDEKTAIRALDRLDPVLPLSLGRTERHGTLSLYAAFNTKTGEALGKTAARHTSAEFVAFPTDIVVIQPRGKEIHVTSNNLQAHKTGLVEEFLTAHPKVHLHFTPTYSTWLNQVEVWFAKVERGVFTSIATSSVSRCDTSATTTRHREP